MASKISAVKLHTVEEHEIGSEDRVFFGHRVHAGSEPLTMGVAAGWYYQIRGTPVAHGPFAERADAEAEYRSLSE